MERNYKFRKFSESKPMLETSDMTVPPQSRREHHSQQTRTLPKFCTLILILEVKRVFTHSTIPSVIQHWLDPLKRVARQIRTTSPVTLYLGVKFYAADPCRLIEEITRYQFFLQVSNLTELLYLKLHPLTLTWVFDHSPYILCPHFFRSSSMCYKAACPLLRISV